MILLFVFADLDSITTQPYLTKISEIMLGGTKKAKRVVWTSFGNIPRTIIFDNAIFYICTRAKLGYSWGSIKCTYTLRQVPIYYSLC